jgi:DNA (cytosine-5)-methyltransferase 1
MNELALFAGAGGGILGAKLLGFRTVCAVEIEHHAASILVARQNDGSLPAFPIWDNVCTFDGKPWRGIVDVVSGGFPCQDISCANTAGADGLDGERSGLWKEMFRIICDVRPFFVLVENSPMLTIRGLEYVLGNLASVGFNAEWGVLGANSVTAPHLRERIWILAYSNQERLFQLLSQHDEMERGRENPSKWRQHWNKPKVGSEDYSVSGWWENTPDTSRVADGVAHHVDRLMRTGNGQVPGVVRKAWHVLCQRATARHCGTGQNIA